MRVPRRKFRDTPSPQITSFLASFAQPKSPSTRSSIPTPPRQIEDGIELVPIERQVSSCAKFLVPGQEEKEVVLGTQPDVVKLSAKPLPSLPDSKWNRMPIKHRMLVILCIQIATVLTIGLSLLSIKSRVDRRIEDGKIKLTPPNTPSMPTPPSKVRGGTFQLFMNNTQEDSSSCLAAANETGAWTCYPQLFQISLFPASMGETDQPFLLLKSLQSPDIIRYGSDNAFQTNVTVTIDWDPDHPDYGWAYYFRTTYDRTVVLRESQMGQEEDMKNGPTNVLIGDRPWRCMYPDVTIEGYIYVTRNSTTNSTVVLNEAFSYENLPYAMRYSEQYNTPNKRPQCSQMIMREDGVLTQTSELMNLTLNEATVVSRAFHNSYSEKEPSSKRQQPKMSNSCRCQ